MGYGFKIGDRVIRQLRDRPDRVGTVEDVVRHFDNGSLRPAYIVRYDDQPSVLTVPLPGRFLEDYEPPQQVRPFFMELRVEVYDRAAFDGFVAESASYDWLKRIQIDDAEIVADVVRTRLNGLPGLRCADTATWCQEDMIELKNAKDEDDFSALHDESEPF